MRVALGASYLASCAAARPLRPLQAQHAQMLTLECQAPTTEKALARCCALQVCLVEAPDLAKAGSKVSAMISALGSKTGSQVALDSFVRYQIGEKA